MLADLSTLMTKPGTFFEQRDEDPSVKGPLSAVAAVAVVGVVGAAVSLGIQVVRLPGSVGTLAAIGGVFALVLRAVMPVVVWLVYSGFFLGITALLDGEGEPRDTILLAGWGMAPRALGVLVVSALVLVANLTTPVPTTATAEAMQSFTQQLNSHPANLVTPLVQLAFFLWSGYIWVAAVEHARDVDRSQAAIAVGVPVAIEVLVTFGLFAFAVLSIGA